MRWMMSAMVAVAAASLWTVAAEAESPWYVEGSVGGYFRDSQSEPDVFYHSATPNVTVPGTLKQTFSPGIDGSAGESFTSKAWFHDESSPASRLRLIS